MCRDLASFPGPKRRRKRKGVVSALCVCANFLGFNLVLISGRVLMTPSKSYG